MYSLQTRMKALAIAGVMAASVAGSAVSAFAMEAAPAGKQLSNVPVEKTVQVANGITLPKKEMTFKATFSKSTVQGVTTENAPEIGGLTLTFENGSELTKTGEMEMKELSSVVPGEYVYTLTEDTKNDLNNKGYGWTCNPDGTNYVLRVYVKSDHTAVYTVLKSTDDNGQLDNEAGNNKKLDKATFSNIYTKRGGSGDDGSKGDPSLVVNKKVIGTYGDMNQYFKFTVKFDVPDTDKRIDPKFKMSFKNNGDGKEDGSKTLSKTDVEEEYDLNETAEYIFYLRNNGSVSFDDLPAGTTYTLTEAGADRYTSKFEITQNGTEIKPKGGTGKENEGLTVSNLLVGEKENKVVVTNTATDITITGVVTHSAPFVIMVGALFVAVGGYVVLKKRIEE